MKVVVFGASGKVGHEVVRELLKRGFSVRAFVRDEKKLQVADDTLEVFVGDVYIQSDVESAVEGVGAVISTLGSWGTKQKDVLSTWSKYVMPAMERAGVARVVSLTGELARSPTDSNTSLRNRLLHPIMMIGAGKILRDGEEHIDVLAQSSLDWTVLRSPVMISSSKNSYSLSGKRASLLISRKAVACALINLLDNKIWMNKTPYISWN